MNPTETPLVLGKTRYSIIHYFNKFTESFDVVEHALQNLLKRKEIAFGAFSAVISNDSGKYDCDVTWSIKTSNTSAMDGILLELNGLKEQHQLFSLAVVLEGLLLCGISFNNDAMVYTSSGKKTVLHEMRDLRKANKFCDITFVIGGDESMMAHKAVLSASSTFFAESLDENTNSMNITNTSAGIFSQLLDFLYIGNIVIMPDNANLLCEAGKNFDLPKLSILCKIYEDLVSSTTSFPKENFDPKVKNIAAASAESAGEIKHLPTPIFPLVKKNERKAKQAAYATLQAWGAQNSIDDENEMVQALEDDPKVSSNEENSTALPTFYLPLKKRNSSSDQSYSSGRKKFACPVCFATFSQILTYRLHLFCHDDGPAYNCLHCGKTETSTNKLKEHMRMVHVKGSSSNENNKIGKVVIGKAAVSNMCRICNRTFSHFHNLTVHMKTHTKPATTMAKQNSHPCSVCDKSFRSKSHLSRHMITHTGERKHCCTTCGKLFLKSDHLKRHERIHTSERPFTCEECGKTFRDKDHLKRHHLSHSDERPYFCEICGKQFKDKSTLLSHQKSHSVTSLACDICGKLFKTQQKLVAHKIKHADAKHHICEICGKKFPFNGRLRKHMLSHTGARPFHCETCGKQFRDSHSLRLHQKKHTGIGLHPCSVCGKEFTNPFHLRRHERVHTGEKPFQCEVCKKSFTRTDNLEVHKRTCITKKSFLIAVAPTSWNNPEPTNLKSATQSTKDLPIPSSESPSTIHASQVSVNGDFQNVAGINDSGGSSVVNQQYPASSSNETITEDSGVKYPYPSAILQPIAPENSLPATHNYDQPTAENTETAATVHDSQVLNFELATAVNFMDYGTPM